MRIILTAANKNIKLILNYVIGPAVFCILVYAIVQQVQKQPDWRTSVDHILHAFGGASLLTLSAVFGLMLLNWGIEARKWQLAIRNIQRLSLYTACKAVFSGTTLAFFTPNRVGEYMGRILYLQEGRRIPAIALTVVCSIAQLLITLILGTGGLLVMKNDLIAGSGGSPNVIFWLNLLLCLVLAAAIVLTLFYFRVSWLAGWVERMPKTGKWVSVLKALEQVNATIQWRILSLSLTRYVVFTVQYYLLFSVFGVETGWWQAFWSVSVVFLIVAVVPSMALITELGVRWGASVEVLQIYSSNTAGILATSLAVWIVNLVIPALIGSIMILGLKIFRNK